MLLSEYLQREYGGKLYKIALDGGFTCPNRDGTLGDRGCIFCSGKGSGEFAQDRTRPITEQIEAGKKTVAAKNPGGKYIAYFQAFTNTYAPVEVLREKYTEAVMHPDIAALSVATRPDCLPADVLKLLEEMNRIKPVWVELGLQTIHPETAAYIRRGYALDVYDRAVNELDRIGISQIITHVILGLPGETEKMMKETVAYVAAGKASGIKLQLLHVLAGTDLAEAYAHGAFQTLSMEAYITLVKECVALLPPEMVIHRLTGDGDKKSLIAPLWSANKRVVLNAMRKAGLLL